MAERRAYVCYDKEGKVHQRRFLLPNERVPSCPDHGRMIRQPNKPYRKKSAR